MPIKKDKRKKTRVPDIYQLGPNRFLVIARWMDATGRRRKRERVFNGRLGEAVALQEQLKGSPPKKRPSRQRFGDFATRWMRNRRQSSKPLAESTKARYELSLAHLIVAFGNYWVDAIDDLAVEDWQEAAARDNSPYTVNGWHRLFRLVLDRAVREKLLPANPARQVPALSEPRTKGRRGTSLEVEEFRRLLVAVDELSGVPKVGIAPDIARHILALAWVGARMGESLAWRFTDIVDGELRIERSVWHRHEKATKTDDPRRVTIVEPLRHVFEEQRLWLMRMQHPGLESGLIFPARPQNAKAGAARRSADEVSWYRSHSLLTKPLARVVERAGIPAISPHSFRRTCEDLQRNAGVNALVRRAQSGWRTEDAQAIYANVPRSERDAAARIFLGYVTEAK